MSNGWENYDPAPIEVFHSEALKEFHEVAKTEEEHANLSKALCEATNMPVEPVKTVDGIQFNNLLAKFKTKVMQEYGISSAATLKTCRTKGNINE